MPAGVTNYPYQTGAPSNGTYVISNTANPANILGYLSDNDHTGNLNGYMMVVNADYPAAEVYRKLVVGLCPNTTYVFTSFLANNNTPASVSANCSFNYIYPNVKFQVEYPLSVIQGSTTSGNLPLNGNNLFLNWQQFGFVFTTGPSQTSVYIVMKNNAPGGCGNDYVVDDISLSACGPGISLSTIPNNTLFCVSSTVTFQSNYNSGSYINPQYQWQFSSNNGFTWNNIVGATSSNYVIPVIASSDVGLYRLFASESGNINLQSCRIIAGPITFSVAGVSVNSQTICSGQPVTLTSSGSTSYTWSTGAITNSITVNPLVTTAYSVSGTTGSCSNMAVSTVSVIPNSSITVTGNTLICNGSTTTLTASGIGTYTWSTGNVGSSIVIAPTISTNYTVTSSVFGSCNSISSVSVNIISPPTLSVSNGTICAGNSFVINPSGASSYTYSSGTSTITPAVSTNYTITGIDVLSNCTASVICSVSVVPQPALTVNSGSICSGSSFTLMPTGFNSYTYTAGSSIVSPTTTTSYSVIGTNTLGCVVTNTVVSTVTVVAQPILSVNSGSICTGSSFTMVPTGGLSYTFSAGSNIVSPPSTSNYTVTGSNIAGCTSSAIATVTVIPNPIFTLVSNSSTLCLGENTIINAIGASNYLWNTGQITNSISVSPIITTVYTVTSTNSIGLFCSSIQTISVKVIPQTTVSLHGGGDICLGTSTIIYALGASNYSWSSFPDKPTPKTFSVSVNPIVTTIYTVTALSSLSCPATGTIQVTVNPLPIVYAGADTTINIDETYMLHGTGNVDVGFLSPIGSTLTCNFCASVLVNPKETTCYILKGENGYNCAAFDEICISVTKDWDVYIPNTFTPNSDNVNDLFIPLGYGISAIKLNIFDRWGTEIFKSTNEIMGWDGKYKGLICEQGIYVYKVEISTMAGTVINKTGHINLIGKTK